VGAGKLIRVSAPDQELSSRSSLSCSRPLQPGSELIEVLKDQIASARKIFESNPEAVNDEPLAEFPLHGDEAKTRYDLEVFANPPYQLDEESFKRLENRMQMKDSDWQKDD
jgi:hypothetical protein